MNGEHLAHLERINHRLNAKIAEKYRLGQETHGGELWRKAGMLAHTEMELLDQITYLYTMQEQLETVLALLERGHLQEATDGLRAILKPDPQD